MRRRSAFAKFSAITASMAAGILRASSAYAIAWNATQPTFSATSTNGLGDPVSLFINENVVNNLSNSTRGTGTYLGDGWVLTAQHVIQNGSTYGSLPSPSQITMTVNIGGVQQTYTADALSTDGSADIGLLHLAGTQSGPAAQLPGVLKSQIYSGSSESNSLVQIGGFGYFGALGSATLNMSATFHRAFNIASASGGFVNISANASSRLVNNGYLLGIGESGDSGSGMWMGPGPDSNSNLADYFLVGAAATSNGFNFGSSNQYTRVSSHFNWVYGNSYAGHTSLNWDTNPGSSDIQDGSGTWDLAAANFGNGIDNFAWDNSTTKNVTFGAHRGAAGTVTLGASVSVQNMMFNPASSGNYTIAGSGANTIALSTTTIITSWADATVSAKLTGAAGGTVTKIGPAVLTLSGNNALAGTISVGNGATSGGNGNGALRVTTTSALAGLSVLRIQDNNSAHAIFQLDGTSGNIALPASLTHNWNANNDGPAATAANIIENIAGDNTINGAVTYFVGGVGYGIASDSGTLTLAGNFTASGTTGKTFYLRGAGNGAFTGVLSGTGGAINLVGSGIWTLNTANTFTGSVTIGGGGILSTNRITSEGTGGTASGIGASSSAATNLILSGGTLRYTGAGTTSDRLFTVAAPGGTLDASGSGSLNFFNTGSIVTSDAAGRNASTVSGSSILTVTSGGMSDLAIGMPISGTGIPAGATIVSIDPNTGTVAISSPASASGSAAITFGATARILTLTGTSSAANTLAGSLSNSASGATLGLSKSGNGAWILSGISTCTGATSVTGGTLTLASSSSLASPSISVSSGATLNANGSLNINTALACSGTTSFGANPGASGPAARKLASLSLGAGGLVTVGSSASHANRTVLSLGSINFAGTLVAPLGKLDLKDNDLIVASTPLATIATDITSAYNGGAWDGDGITSSSAAAIASDSSNPHKTALGYATASALGVGSFDNQSVAGSAVLVRYTFTGDANLDGIVNSGDFTLLAQNFNAGSLNWSDGDFNYDGTVNALDFNSIATNFGLALPSALPLASMVPEPGMLLLPLISLLAARRRACGR